MDDAKKTPYNFLVKYPAEIDQTKINKIHFMNIYLCIFLSIYEFLWLNPQFLTKNKREKESFVTYFYT